MRLPSHRRAQCGGADARLCSINSTRPVPQQADVGVAVLTATDIARGAAGVTLTEPGLGRIVRLVRVARTVHTRMLTYLVNKIAKELLQARV